MVRVHHLNNSRSQRVLWALEELGVEYEVVPYRRDPRTMLAPPSLKAAHPLGKAPVIEDGDLRLAESGAILDYLARRYGDGRLRPAEGSAELETYLEWLHYAEGSAMLPLMIRLYTLRLGDAAAPLAPRLDAEIANHFGWVDGALAGRSFLVGSDLSAADVQMSFVLEVGRSFGLLSPYAGLSAYLDRLHARPAFVRAIERGGPYDLA